MQAITHYFGVGELTKIVSANSNALCLPLLVVSGAY